MKSVLETIQGGSGYFEKHGVPDPRLNMEHLLAHVLGCRRMDLYLQFDRPLTEEELAPLRELLKRRSGGEPLQHILGLVEFCGHDFATDGRALIPRPETEQLTERLIEHLKGKGSPVRILDMGTGSGVIGLSIALAVEEASVVLADISPPALDLARENAKRLQVPSERLTFIETDLFAKVEGSFDLVVANLPYLTAEDMQNLDRDVSHDPANALDGGSDGLGIIQRLLQDSPRFMNESGLVALEIGAGQADTVAGMAKESGFSIIDLFQDYVGIERFVFATA